MPGTVDSSEAVPPGAVLGDFRLGGLLGSGGMGQVYRAEQLSLRRAVALKVLPGSSLASREARSRFVREAALVAKLSHPAIVPVYQAGEQDGVLYYAMELVDGLPLDDYVHERRLGMRAVVDLMARVCGGIEAAHRRGILHRDLKPANILVDGRGQPRILDFGLATMLTAEAAEFSVVSGAGGLCGTLAFMAPEQTLGDRDLLDVRTDLYAVGVMLYRLCTGRPPTDLSGPLPTVLERLRSQDPSPPGRLARMPADLEVVLLKALAKEPDRRYQSAAALATDLRAVLSGHPVSARRPTTVYRLRRYASRHRAAVAAAAAVALLLGALTVAFIARLNRERGVAVAHAQRAEAALADLRGMAPTCEELAALLMDRRDFPKALQTIDHAIALNPETAVHHRVRGDILLPQLRLDEADAAYSTALRLDPSCPGAAKALAVCRGLAEQQRRYPRLPPAVLADAAKELVEVGNHAGAALLLEGIQAGARHCLEAYGPLLQRAGFGTHFLVDGEGLLCLVANGRQIRDLSALQGLPLSRLHLAGTPIRDLETLAGMPLIELRLGGCKGVETIAPLRDAPLAILDLAGTAVTDLSPLKGMPLRELTLDCLPVRDLASLQGLALEYLVINGTRVSDLAPLRGMPLRYLNANSLSIRDLSPLQGMPLAELFLNAAQVSDLEPLRGAPLKTLDIRCMSPDLSVLGTLPLQSLALNNTFATHLDFVRGMPLRELYLTNAPNVRDLSPLRDCRTLEVLHFSASSPPDSLEPLRGLPNLRTINGKPWVDFWREVDAR